MTPGPGTRFGPYVLGRVLGRGGMAVVHEATHASTGRVVALKLIRPEHAGPDFADRLRREGRAQAALDHPNVVTIYEAGTSEHGPWLAMRLVEGTTLSDLIDAGTLDAASALDILDQVAAALDAAHAAGLVHRDVKPRNVLVSEDGTAYLADFGLSRPSAGDGATVTGHFMGTLAYAAPEVLRGEEPGPAADRYALAAVLFECLTGSTVFPRPSHAAVVFAHTNEPAPRVSGRRAGVPPALDAVVIDGLAKDPAARPATAHALVTRARSALRGARLGPPPPRSPVPPQDDATTGATLPMPSAPAPAPAGRVRRAAAMAGVAVLAAGAGAAAVALLPDDGAPAATAELPAPPAGTQLLGSDLALTGRSVDCLGGTVKESSPACTVFQDRDARRTLVVPRDGVVRRWAVRSASGEFALAVLRRRDDGYFQIARSRNEFVGSLGPHAFATDLAVEQGDRLALVVVRGSGVGVADVAGVTTGRWVPPLRGTIAPQEAGPAGELLLRVDYVPGARQIVPAALSGAEAERAPGGEVIARRVVRVLPGEPPIVFRVGVVNGRGVLDLRRDGRRFARSDVPGLAGPPGDIVHLAATAVPDSGGQVGIDVWFTPEGSDRLIRHYYGYSPVEGLVFVN